MSARVSDVGGSTAKANKGTTRGPDGGKRPPEGPPPTDNSAGEGRAPETYQLPKPVQVLQVLHRLGCNTHRTTGATRERAAKHRVTEVVTAGKTARRRGSAIKLKVAPTQTVHPCQQDLFPLPTPITRMKVRPAPRLAVPKRSDSLLKILRIAKNGSFSESPKTQNSKPLTLQMQHTLCEHCLIVCRSHTPQGRLWWSAKAHVRC